VLQGQGGSGEVDAPAHRHEAGEQSVTHRHQSSLGAALADIRAGRFIEALLRPDRSARRAVQVVLDALTAEGARYSP
jgi:hypothetical protein